MKNVLGTVAKKMFWGIVKNDPGQQYNWCQQNSSEVAEFIAQIWKKHNTYSHGDGHLRHNWPDACREAFLVNPEDS